MAQLSDQQLEALAEGTSEDAVKVLAEAPALEVFPPPPEKTEAEKQQELAKQEQEQNQSAMKQALDLPFNASNLSEFARKRFKERLPSFITNTERQIRQAVAYGADSCDVGTLGATNFHRAVFNHLHDAGFRVLEKEVDTDKSRIEVTIYSD